MSKLRMGVLGTSDHYALRISTPLKYSLLVEPYGIASRDAQKAERYAVRCGFVRTWGSYEALIEDPEVDFVYCPLPNNFHLEYIKKAADAGKPILCEKPLCLNAAEAVEAAEYCYKKGTPLMEAFMYRFHPQWIRAGEIVRAGELGDVIGTESVFSYNNRDAANIRNRADTGGGALLDIGCYTVSSYRFLMGREPERVMSTLWWDPVFKTDIRDSVILDYGEGRSAIFMVGTQQFPFQRVRALGTGGSLSIEVPFNMYPDVPGRVTVTVGNGRRVIETEIADQYLLEFDAFAEAVINKREVPTPVSDAVANMAVLDAVFASGASGRWEEVKRY
jgi:predicted dehydrogenase